MDRIRMQLLTLLLLMIRNTIRVTCLMAPYAADKAING